MGSMRLGSYVGLVVKFTAAVMFAVTGPRLRAADEVGTGGIGIDRDTEHWAAPHPGLPYVLANSKSGAFEIRTANSRTLKVPSDNPSRDRFLTLWFQLHDPKNGYFSATGLPFHSAETLIAEAPDYGHLTTS